MNDEELTDKEFIDFTSRIPEVPSQQEVPLQPEVPYQTQQLPEMPQYQRPQQEVPVYQPYLQPVPVQMGQQGLSLEDQEINRLQRENMEKQTAFDKRRQIEQLKIQNQRLEEMNKNLNPRFKFTRAKAKFWLIAGVVSITVAVVIVKIVQKFI